jgi:hypothetical protein
MITDEHVGGGLQTFALFVNLESGISMGEYLCCQARQQMSRFLHVPLIKDGCTFVSAKRESAEMNLRQSSLSFFALL